jgi:hypothetical protein
MVVDNSVVATDRDGDGVTDATENDPGADSNNPDTDGDTTTDALDTDSDGGGTNGATEATGDNDGDGTPDYRGPKDDHGPDADPDAAELPAIDETDEEQPYARGVTE